MTNLFDYLTWRGDISIEQVAFCPPDMSASCQKFIHFCLNLQSLVFFWIVKNPTQLFEVDKPVRFNTILTPGKWLAEISFAWFDQQFKF